VQSGRNCGYNAAMATFAPQKINGEMQIRHCFKGSWTDRFLLLLALAAIFFAWQQIHSKIGSGPPMVMIYHDDQLLARYPIPEEGEPIHFHAAGELGTSEIVIDRNGARFVSSPCSSAYCVAHGPRKEHGDVIACVPNRILIAIEGSHNDGFLDAVVE